MEIGVEQQHFLNEEQKQIKSDIINKLLDIFKGELISNNVKFNDQTFMDLIISVIIIFNREVLIDVFANSNMPQFSEKIMDNIFSVIKERVLKRLPYELEKIKKMKENIQ